MERSYRLTNRIQPRHGELIFWKPTSKLLYIFNASLRLFFYYLASLFSIHPFPLSFPFLPSVQQQVSQSSLCSVTATTTKSLISPPADSKPAFYHVKAASESMEKNLQATACYGRLSTVEFTGLFSWVFRVSQQLTPTDICGNDLVCSRLQEPSLGGRTLHN